MSVFISGRLQGTNVTLTHEQSGSTLKTTPPKDNQGDGSSFSPTDLFAASLGACAATTMALYAANHKVPVDGMAFRVEKVMQAAPRRVKKIGLHLDVLTRCDDATWEKLVAAARACPVRASLHPDVEIEEVFKRVERLA